MTVCPSLPKTFAHTHSVQFPYIRKSTGYTSISRNAYCSYSLWSD